MRCLSSFLFALALVSPVLAQNERPILQPPNPVVPGLGQTPDGTAQTASEIPAPAPRPAGDEGRSVPPSPTARPQTFANSSERVAESQSSQEASACLAALQTTPAAFEPRSRHEGEGACGIDDAVELQSIGAVALQPAALLSCPAALTFTRFWSDTMAPQAVEILNGTPSRVFVAASYACRGRNNVAGARISEHGFGRAIDIRGLAMEDGRTWSVVPHEQNSEEPDALFQRAIRQASCGPFTTVLGPGSDGHHMDHMHFDVARRSSAYCR